MFCKFTIYFQNIKINIYLFDLSIDFRTFAASNKCLISKDMSYMQNSISTIDVESRLFECRNQLVMLDHDVAFLYGVATKRINEAVKNNPRKFPSSYLFRLSQNEIQNFAVEKSDRKIVSSKSRYAPTVFTEQGLYMLATILKSDQAIDTTLAIIDTFTKVRQLAKTMAELQNVADGCIEQQNFLQKTGK